MSMSDDDRTSELSRFLKERRSRLRPTDVGLPATGRRRVVGLRREEVATLAGIGVSWYTSLENGEATGVSEATLTTVADALRLSVSEREYLLALAGLTHIAQRSEMPERLIVATLNAIAFPAYIISPTWEILEYNDAFRRVWGIHAGEVTFNAVERLFLHHETRAMHGARLAENIRPVIAMLQSSIGRQPDAISLVRLRDRLVADEELRAIWNAYEIVSPLVPNACTIESPIGTFSYETMTLVLSPTQGLVVQVPDEASRQRLETSPR
jgi:transcriptional regulator with XRE-family HTH domain